MTPLKTIKVFVTSDKMQFSDAKLAKAHQLRLDTAGRIKPLTNKFLDAASASYDSKQLECADAFGLWLFEKGLLKLPAKKAAPAKPTVPAKPPADIKQTVHGK